MNDNNPDREIVEVFKTNVKHPKDARFIIRKIEGIFPGSRVNFDLDDYDKVLRVAFGDHILESNDIEVIVKKLGFGIKPLP